jgi:phosphatidylethanolamine-binding protein (PEBP) family uncharacterized protein
LKKTVFLLSTTLTLLTLFSCTNESKNAAQMGVDFEWQQIDKGAQENPAIRLLGVPDGTKRFLVSLVDLNLNGFDHGSGYVDNDGSGIIARGTVKGSYNGPDPPYPNLKHSYEITVKALDEKGTVIGIGKKAKIFLFNDTKT